MTINSINNRPSFGNLYSTASSSLARQKLSPFYEIISSQGKLIKDLDNKGYDVLVSMRDDAQWFTKGPFAINIEVCKKFTDDIKETFTPLLELSKKYSATKTIELDENMGANILEFLDEVKTVISKK